MSIGRGIRRRRLTLHGRMGLRIPVDSTFSSRGPRTIQIIENVDIIQIFASVHLTGLNVLAKNRRNSQVNFIVSGLEVAKTRFQTFLRGKSVLFKWKSQIPEFHAHAMERGEFLKR